MSRAPQSGPELFRAAQSCTELPRSCPEELARSFEWSEVGARERDHLLACIDLDLPKDNATLLAITGLVVTLPTTLLMMLQTGSSENYAFTLAFFMTLLLVCLLPRLPRLDAFACKVGNGSLAVGFILTALAVSIVLTGHKGVIRPQGDQDLIDRRIACLKKLPVPLYVNNRVLSLPWNTPGTPYVRSFYYERDRENGKEYANGGIGEHAGTITCTE